MLGSSVTMYVLVVVMQNVCKIRKNQQREVPGVNDKIKNSSGKILNKLHLPLC